MHIHYIGLGKMGLAMVERMLHAGYAVTAFDLNQKAREQAEKIGAQTVSELTELLQESTKPRTIWMMVPHTVVDIVIEDLLPKLKKGDLLVDGGNSPYRLSIKRAAMLKKKGIGFLDIGVSGGPHGARYGACMMIGGTKTNYAKIEDLVAALCVKDGYAHVGKSGSGHFVKMIHNGIEYGMMQAMAEGFSIMNGTKEFSLDLKQIAHVYSHGSVIESRLMDWMHDAFKEHGNALKAVSGTAIGTGEGKWTVKTAHELDIPDHVIHEAFLARKRSEKKPNYQAKIIMALRNQFGGHSIDS